MIIKKNIESLAVLLQTPQKIVLIPHSRPDPDALGSVLTLKHILEKKHKIDVISPSVYPDFLKWMPGQDSVIIYDYKDSKKRQLCKQILSASDLIFCVDFSNPDRLENLKSLVMNQAKAKFLILDHHENPKDFAKYTYLDPKAAASAELVYDFIHEIDFETYLDRTCYELIYAGIMVDTGSFKFASTTSKVHQIASRALEIGVDTNKIQRSIYDSFSPERLKMLGYMISQNMKHLQEYKTIYFTLSQADQKKFKSKIGDTEGFVNYGLAVEDVKLATILIERKDHVKLSFRSVGDLCVSQFAQRHFNGGGHKNASAGKLYMSLEEASAYFEEKLALLISSIKDKPRQNQPLK